MEGYEKRLKRGTKTRILKRDGGYCVLCNGTNQLVVHHYHDNICNPVLSPKGDLPYNAPYWNTRDEDLITLCNSCHGKVHANPSSPLSRLLEMVITIRLGRQR